MSNYFLTIAYVVLLPGFLVAGGLAVEFVDRKLYARFQNRMGPPWFQPLADSIKLLTKEAIVPGQADKVMFKGVPLVALAAAATAFFYIPIWSIDSLWSFQGDLIVVLYLLTIPTFCFFLGGWFSTSLFATIGAIRTLTALFAYEVPLFMAVLSPALLAGTWSLSGMVVFYQTHPLWPLFNLLGFAAGIVALLGKLEKAPFDIPEAETELAGGTFVEYSGKLLAIFRMTVDVEAVVVATLMAAVFMPWGMNLHPAFVIGLLVVKVLFIVSLLALLRTILARLRIDQMVHFCWKWVAPAALVQLMISVLLNGVLTR